VINPFITIDRKTLLCCTFQNINGYLFKERQVVSLFKSLQIIGSFLESKPLPFNLFQMISSLNKAIDPSKVPYFFNVGKGFVYIFQQWLLNIDPNNFIGL
jgi:hypothetical protein